MSGQLYFSVGLPRSGKSTFADKWAVKKPKRVAIGGDDIRLAIYGQRYLSKPESLVHTIKYLTIEALLVRGYDVFYDGTNTTIDSVESVMKRFKNAEYVIFDTSKEECKQRAIDTNQLDLIDIIDRMSSNINFTILHLHLSYPDNEIKHEDLDN